MARQKLKRKRLSQPWNGAGPGWSKDTQKSQGADLLFEAEPAM